MNRWVIVALLIPGLALGQALRVDGSSDKAADESFAAMVNAQAPAQRQKLLTALVQINMEGVQTARDAEATEASRHPSAARVRSKITGMTAEEIIALGAEAQTRTPGLHVVINDQSSPSLSPLRIDGSSDKAANDSFSAMVKAASADQRQKLVIALVQINMRGIQSARDGMFDPSAARVRTAIDGMTAEEIIAAGKDAQAASHGTTVSIHNPGDKDPGVPPELLRPLAGGKPNVDLAGTTWDVENRANGTVQHYVYRLDADHTATMIETDLKSNGVTRWEAAGNEFRLSINNGYSVMLGTLDGMGVLHGDGGNQMGYRYEWTATKR